MGWGKWMAQTMSAVFQSHFPTARRSRMYVLPVPFIGHQVCTAPRCMRLTCLEFDSDVDKERSPRPAMTMGGEM